MITSNPLDNAVTITGLVGLARALGVSHQAVRKWQKARRMPRTEWTGETRYSEIIEEQTGRRVTKAQLLAKWPEPIAAQDAA